MKTTDMIRDAWTDVERAKTIVTCLLNNDIEEVYSCAILYAVDVLLCNAQTVIEELGVELEGGKQ